MPEVEMADTRVQREVENWIRESWMPERYGQSFRSTAGKLSSGGFYNFNAVSEDDRIGAAISTSDATTRGGKPGAGKLLKIRSDLYFLLLARFTRRVVIFTEASMRDLCAQEQQNGRIPQDVELELAGLPEDLALRLRAAREVASQEVSPR